MAEPSSSFRHASFWTQANALLRKNLTFQKRNKKSTIRLICFPFILCLLIFGLQLLVDSNTSGKSAEKCSCQETDTKGEGQTNRICGIGEDGNCPIPHPHEWPPLLQIPVPQYRTVKTDSLPFPELPDASCRADGSCPATFLITGTNQSLGEALGGNMFPSSFVQNSSDVCNSLSQNVLGSSSWPDSSQYLESAFFQGLPVYDIQSHCTKNSVPQVIKAACPVDNPFFNIQLICTRGLTVWRKSAAEVNNAIYKGYWKGNPDGNINEITAAYDFLNTDSNNFNVSIWYNSTYATDLGTQKVLLRVPRSMNLVSNAYLQFLKGPGAKMLFEFVKEMPKQETPKFRIDISSSIGPLFFTWVILMLFPVILSSLVYEKQQRLRIMMKMHGLGDGPYWLISYAYFLVLSVTYMLSFVIFGSIIGLKFFKVNQYSLQFVFYFLYLNLQISLAFLLSVLSSNVKTATVVAYIFVFGTGLLGDSLFRGFVQDTSFPRAWIIVMELYPGLALYRGLYEFAQDDGIQWNDLSDSSNGIKEVLIIIAFEWLLVLLVAYQIDKISGSGKSLRFFMEKFMKKKVSSFKEPGIQTLGSKVSIQMDKPDVCEEREKVEQLLHESCTNYALVVDDLKKVYPGRDGNPDKFAVRGLSLAVPQGECFGMLGPNGAGKTSFISMMIGLTKPTSGAAYVEGHDIGTDMNNIYTSMGVCPQHDLLWETLTGREHLLFYGRLKNLKGSALTQAVEESLKSVNLFYGSVADKQAGKYSGGMKRRLSVAISLIGDPKVVYMDEPSTGLDPASRNYLWNVVKQAKKSRAIILTTHSMEEAEVLCDRLGIFADGSLQCIGNPKELKARHGGSYLLTVTTSSNHEEDVESLVRGVCGEAKRVYKISGTQKFELPKHRVKIAQVVKLVENAKTRFTVQAWGLADTTLEDVFIKIVSGAADLNVM